MSDVRRVSEFSDSPYGTGGQIADEEDGFYALIPWEDLEKLEDRVRELETVLRTIGEAIKIQLVND